jgi:hypothetical protein
LKLLKFKSSLPRKYVDDILINRRLYCAAPSELNDALEGIRQGGREAAHYPDRGWREIQSTLRVCSLTRKACDISLWAHYGEGFKGIAFLFELPDNLFLGNESDIRLLEVEYLPQAHLADLPDDPTEAAFHSLKVKQDYWRNEDEVRIVARADCLVQGRFFEGAILERVFIGNKMPEHRRKQVLRLCRKQKIEVSEAIPVASNLGERMLVDPVHWMMRPNMQVVFNNLWLNGGRPAPLL